MRLASNDLYLFCDPIIAGYYWFEDFLRPIFFSFSVNDDTRKMQNLEIRNESLIHGWANFSSFNVSLKFKWTLADVATHQCLLAYSYNEYC